MNELLNRVNLRTPESVELEFTLAGIGNRALAVCIDSLILWSVIVLLGIVGLGVLSAFPDQGTWILAILTILVFAWYVGYFVAFETLWRGQTPGKRVARIRVIRDDGRPVGLAQSSLRGLLRAVDDLVYLGSFAIIFSAREKRLGDWAAGTIVIQEQPPGSTASLYVSPAAQELARKLPGQTDLSRLSPANFAVVRQFLAGRATMDPDARAAKGVKIAEQLRTLLQLESIPGDGLAETFIEGVYLAYQGNVPELPG